MTKKEIINKVKECVIEFFVDKSPNEIMTRIFFLLLIWGFLGLTTSVWEHINLFGWMIYVAVYGLTFVLCIVSYPADW